MPAAAGIRAGRAFVELGVHDRLTRGLRTAQRKLQAFGTGVRSIGTQLATVGVAAAAPFALSAKTFAGFEQQMARVRALTGANEKDFGRLSDAAKRLGETTVFSASQAAEAMSFFALAGFEVEQILGAIGPALNLAAAGQIEIAEAADIAAKIMAGMGLEAQELGGAVDVLAKAMTTANTDLGQLGAAMKFVGPVAKSAGRDLEEIVATIQLLSNAGIQGEMAGTTLRGMLLALTSPSREAADELDRLGVRVLDAEGNVRSLADIVDDMNRAMQGLGGGERLEIIGRIFSARQAAGVAELLSQGGDRLREFTAALGDAGGTADRIAGIQLDTLAGDATILTSALEGLGIAVGEALGDSLRSVVKHVTRIVGMVTDWVKENRQLVLSIAKTIAIITGIGVGLVLFGAAVSALGGVFGVVATVVSGITTAFGVLGTVLGALLSPIGLVITAVVALGAFILHATGAGATALGWLGDKFRGLKDTALAAWRGIGDALAAGDIGLAVKILWLTLKLQWQKGVNFIKGAWLSFKHFFIDIGQKAFFGLLAAGEIVWHALKVAWIEVVAFFRNLWQGFTATVASTWRKVVGSVERRIHDVHGVLNKDFDADEAKRLSQQQERADLTRIEREKEAALSAVERERDLKRKQEAAVHEQTLGLIGQEYEDARKRLDDEAARQRSASEAALAGARREWEQAIAEAAQKRREAEAGDDGPDAESPDDLLTKVKQSLQGLDGQLDRAAREITVRGTFNAAALQGLVSGGKTEERIAKAAEETAKNTRRIEKAINDNAIAFA